MSDNEPPKKKKLNDDEIHKILEEYKDDKVKM